MSGRRSLVLRALAVSSLAGLLLLPPVAGAQDAPEADAASLGAPGVTAEAAILVNLSDSRVLFSRQAQVRRAPASLTKVVTALVVRDNYHLDEVVTVGREVLATHGSSLGVAPGMRYTVHDLLYALLLKSGNDVAAALAAHHPAGYDHFIELMNAKARALGAVNSQFRNPHGLDADGHFSTPWDMALFGRQLLADPVLAQVVGAPSHSMTWHDGSTISFVNHNKLLANHEWTIGGKTGFTSQAGHCLFAAADTPTGRMLTVVLRSQSHYDDTVTMWRFGQEVELRGAGGGGGSETILAAPPVPPDAVLAIVSQPRGPDPRDQPVWLAGMLALAALASVSVARSRRRHPLSAVTELDPWPEPVTRRR